MLYPSTGPVPGINFVTNTGIKDPTSLGWPESIGPVPAIKDPTTLGWPEAILALYTRFIPASYQVKISLGPSWYGFFFQYPIPGPDRCWVKKLIPIQYWWWPPHNGHHLIHLHMHFEGQMKWSCQDHRTQNLQKNYFSGFYYEASEQICNRINEIVFHLLNFCCASIGLLSYPCTFVY